MISLLKVCFSLLRILSFGDGASPSQVLIRQSPSLNVTSRTRLCLPVAMDGERERVFVQNYTGYDQALALPGVWYNALPGGKRENRPTLVPRYCEVLVRNL